MTNSSELVPLCPRCLGEARGWAEAERLEPPGGAGFALGESAGQQGASSLQGPGQAERLICLRVRALSSCGGAGNAGAAASGVRSRPGGSGRPSEGQAGFTLLPPHWGREQASLRT